MSSRLKRSLVLLVASAAILFLGCLAAPTAERKLNWVIKYSEPGCQGCAYTDQAWDAVKAKIESTAAQSGLFFSEVNCAEKKDSCRSNGITVYPSVAWMEGDAKIDVREGGMGESEILSYVESILKNIGPDSILNHGNSVPLSEGNYTHFVHNDIWMIKFYSPKCPHCRKMAPQWTKMTDEMAKRSAIQGIYFGEVNCYKYYDLCETNKIEGYPTIQLWVKGRYIEEYLEDNEYGPFKAYASNLVNRFGTPLNKDPSRQETAVGVIPHLEDRTPNKPEPVAKRVPFDQLRLEQQQQQQQEKEGGDAAYALGRAWNPDGTVVDLTAQDFDEKTGTGPWMVKFYAPWCPHCQMFAPTWDEFAEKSKGLVNVGRVNCDKYGNLCNAQNILSYPTVKFMSRGHHKVYEGNRTVKDLEEFVAGLLSETLTKLTAKDIEQLKQDRPLIYILYTPQNAADSSASKVRDVAKQKFLMRSIVTTSEEDVLRNIGVKSGFDQERLFVYKDGGYTEYMGSFDDTNSLGRWLVNEQHPLVERLDKTNSGDLFLDTDYLVLAAFRSKDSMAKEYIESMRAAARTYHRTLAEDVSGRGSKVRFAWIDSQKWGGYLKRVFGLATQDRPMIIVTQAKKDLYYDTRKDGRPIPLAASEIYDTLLDILDGAVEPKSTTGPVIQALRQIYTKVGQIKQAAKRDPATSVLACMAALVVVFFALRRCAKRSRGVMGYSVVKAD